MIVAAGLFQCGRPSVDFSKSRPRGGQPGRLRPTFADFKSIRPVGTGLLSMGSRNAQNMAIQIRTLLERKKVQIGIATVVASFWEHEFLLSTIPFDPIVRNTLSNANRRRTFAAIRSIWREHIVRELDLPTALTALDFVTSVDTFFLQDTLVPLAAYKTFESFLESTAKPVRRSGPIRVYTFKIAVGGTHPAITIWENESGFRLLFVGTLPLEDEHGPEDAAVPLLKVTAARALYMRLEGRCSSRAFRRFRQEMCRIVPCIMRGIDIFEEIHSEQWLCCFKDAIAGRPIEQRGWQTNIEVGQLLDAYFSNATRTDSTDRRIRNSVHLLVQSDQQRHTAIGIALSVAAIESLVCRKGGDIANMFAENTALILEPDPSFRAAAVEFSKDLYDARSRVLHGDFLEHEAEMRRNARALAAAVLKAILERRSFQRRAGVESETPDELFNELRQGKWIPGQLTGVSESPVRALWGAKYEGPTPEIDDESTDQESESDE